LWSNIVSIRTAEEVPREAMWKVNKIS